MLIQGVIKRSVCFLIYGPFKLFIRAIQTTLMEENIAIVSPLFASNRFIGCNTKLQLHIYIILMNKDTI